MNDNLQVFNGKYRQLTKDPIGAGAFGKVYLCEDTPSKKK